MFLSAMAGYYLLHTIRLRKRGIYHAKQKDENDTHFDFSDPAALDFSLRAAFEAGDYFNVLQYWDAFKICDRAPNIPLCDVVTAMRACNKQAQFIEDELQQFFEKYPSQCDVSTMNHIMHVLGEELDTQLASMLVDMFPALHLSLDSCSYEILIAMMVKTRQFSEAQRLLAQMKVDDLSLTARTVFFALKASLSLGDLDQSLNYFGELKASWQASGASEPPVPQPIMVQLVTLACEKRRMLQLMPILAGLPMLAQAMDCAASDAYIQQSITDAAQQCGRLDIVECLLVENRRCATRRVWPLRQYAAKAQAWVEDAGDGFARMNAVIAQWVVLVL